MPACHAGGRGFESRRYRQNIEMLGSQVTPPALGAGELAGSNPAISTKIYKKIWQLLLNTNSNNKLIEQIDNGIVLSKSKSTEPESI